MRLPSCFLCVTEHQPINKPSGGSLANHVADQERDAENQARLDDIELVDLRVDHRSGRREEDAAVGEACHVVEAEGEWRHI